MPNKLLIRLILISTIFMLTACSTTSPLTYGPLTYGPSNNGGAGYFERQRDVYKWMIGSYHNLGTHTPQQAANLVMRRAAEIAYRDGFKWIRILDYETEQRHGSIGGLPATISGNLNRGATSIYPSMNFYGNQDTRVSDRQFRLGVTYALVEYIEFARRVDCQAEKCGTMEFFLEKCSEGWDGGTAELSAMCNKMPDTKRESCIDRTRFVTKDFCGSVNQAAYNVRGMIEERNLGGMGEWYRTEDILQKYTIRSDKWTSVRRKR